jgi:membrane fusion protein YbhG
MNIRRLIIGLLIAGLAAAGVGWRVYGGNAGPQSGLVLLGNVDIRQVDLAFKVSGRLAEMTFDEGDAVSKGDVVAILEKPDFINELELARASVAARSAELQKLQSGARPEVLEQAKAMVASRRASLTVAQSTLKRIEELAKNDFAPHQRHEAALAVRDEAAAALRSAEEALNIAQTGARSEDLQAAGANLQAAEATLSLSERRLADTELRAPNNGIILTRVREPGAIIGVGQTVYTLSLTSPVWIRTYVIEPDLGRIRPGMSAKVHTDGGRTYTGQIGFISPVAEFTPKTVETRKLRTSLVYRLRVIVENADGGLRQGMPVTVVLHPDETD